MDIILTRTLADYSYKELRDYLDENDDSLDLNEAAEWLEDLIAKRLNQRNENAETIKKAAHLALLFIDFAREPGKGLCS